MHDPRSSPALDGLQIPDGLVIRSCTSHPGVLGSIPKREDPGKTGAPCVEVSGSSRVPPREQLCNRYCSNKHTRAAGSGEWRRTLFCGHMVTGRRLGGAGVYQ
jgi:hypothetical protein